MKKKIYIGLLAVSMALTACQKDFLETKPSETLSGAEPQEKLNGLYVMLAKPRSANTRPVRSTLDRRVMTSIWICSLVIWRSLNPITAGFPM